MAKKKIKAEEIKEEVKDLDLEKSDKDLEKVEDAEKVEEKKEEVEKAPAAEEAEKTEEAESADLIVLDSGATVDEKTGLSEEEAKDLVKITKQDGTELFVEKVDEDLPTEDKKEIYEAIVEADKPEGEEVAEDLEAEVNEPMDEEIEEVSYIPAACKTAEASLDNSFYVVKLKSGKYKALKAGKIFNKNLKASLLKALSEGKQLPSETTLFNKIASKVGYTFGAFTKITSKLAKAVTASKNGVLTLENGKKVLAKHLVAAELPDTVPGKANDEAEQLKDFSLDEKDIEKSDIESQVALETKDLKPTEDVKPAASKVKNYYGRLPGKSSVGDEVEWALKDFNSERNKKDKTMAAQIKSLRDATKELRAQKEIIASKEAEIKALKEQIDSINKKVEAMLKSAKINKIIASMHIDEEEEKFAMQEKFAKYSKEQLDAVYETLTACPTEEATIMHERMINEQMKKEASELKGFVPSFKMEEEELTSASDEMEDLVLKRELASQKKF